MHRSNLRNLSALALCCLIWGTTWLAIKINQEEMPRYASLAIRLFLASLFFLAVAWRRGDPLPRGARDIGLYGIVALTIHSLPLALVYTASRTVPSGMTAVLFASLPFFVAIGSHFTIRGEQLTPLRFLGVVLGFAGVAVIFSEEIRAGLDALSWRMLLVVAAAATIAAGNIVLKKYAVHAYSKWSLNGVSMAFAAGAFAVLSLALEGDRSIGWTARSVGSLLYLTAGGSIVSFAVYYWILERVQVTRASLIAFVTPVVAVSAGAVLAGEAVPLSLVAGGGMVLAGILVVNAARRAPRLEGVEVGLPAAAKEPEAGRPGSSPAS